MQIEELQKELSKQIEFCLAWKGDDPRYEDMLKKVTLDDVMQLISDYVGGEKEEFEKKLNVYEISSGGIDDDNSMLVGLIKECREFLAGLSSIEGDNE